MRRLLRGMLWLVLACLALSVLSVLIFRWVNPPYSASWQRAKFQPGRAAIEAMCIAAPGRTSPGYRESAARRGRLGGPEVPEHWGFDVEAIEKAYEMNRHSHHVHGASTISQQVAKNLYLWSGRSYFRKALEAYFTVLIEGCWPKRRILEIYLNIAEFGYGTYGRRPPPAFFP